MSTTCSSPIVVFDSQEACVESLEHRLQRGALTLDEVIAIAQKVAFQLDAYHKKDRRYGVLTPACIVFSSPSDIQIVHSVSSCSMPKSYAAPEVWEGTSVHASDQFSLAAILYQALCGGRVFPGDNDSSVHHSITTGRFIPLAARVPHLADNVDIVFERAFSKNPLDRYPTCSAFVEELVHTIIHSYPQETPLELRSSKPISNRLRRFFRIKFRTFHTAWVRLGTLILLFLLFFIWIASSR